MIDYKELPTDGTAFELLIRELLYRRGLEVYWTGKGPDGGRDIVWIERVKGNFTTFEKRWIVQCKHHAHSGKAVSDQEVMKPIKIGSGAGYDNIMHVTAS